MKVLARAKMPKTSQRDFLVAHRYTICNGMCALRGVLQTAVAEPDNKNHQMQQFDNEFVFITKNNTLEKSIISYYENDKKEMRASGLAEIAKVHQTTPNYLLGFADNNDGFADEALGLLRDVKDQSVREILLKQIRALI